MLHMCDFFNTFYLSKKDGDCEDDVLVGEQKTVDGKPLGSQHRPKMVLSLPKVSGYFIGLP